MAALLCIGLGVPYGWGQVTLTAIVSFAGTNGADPWTGLTRGIDGNFYGTTYYGGGVTNLAGGGVGLGTVYKITPAGVLTPLASFYGTNGSYPRSRLVQASDGNFYGTTHNGGANPNPGIYSSGQGYGTVFRVTPDGAQSVLASFWGTNGACPAGGLVEGPDGNLYGTTRAGGATFGQGYAGFGYGSIFRITTNGALTTFYSFTGGVAGSEPMDPMIFASDGNFYGTAFGGQNNLGMVYRMTPLGAVSTVVSFTQDEGSSTAGLIQGTDGNLYVRTARYDLSHPGAVLRVTLNGVKTKLASLASDPYYSPARAVLEGADGNFYGTLEQAGDHNYGTIFRVTPEGAFTDLISFGLTNGASPLTELIQGKDGALYGTAQGGGVYTNAYGASCGTIFRVSVPLAASPKIRTITKSASASALTFGTIPDRGYQAQFKTDLEQGDWNDLGIPVTASSALTTVSDLDPAGPQRFYRVVLLPESGLAPWAPAEQSQR